MCTYCGNCGAVEHTDVFCDACEDNCCNHCSFKCKRCEWNLCNGCKNDCECIRKRHKESLKKYQALCEICNKWKNRNECKQLTSNKNVVCEHCWNDTSEMENSEDDEYGVSF